MALGGTQPTPPTPSQKLDPPATPTMSFAHADLFAITICKARLSQEMCWWAWHGHSMGMVWVWRRLKKCTLLWHTAKTITSGTNPACPHSTLSPESAATTAAAIRSYLHHHHLPCDSDSGKSIVQRQDIVAGESGGRITKGGRQGEGWGGCSAVSVHHISQTPCRAGHHAGVIPRLPADMQQVCSAVSFKSKKTWSLVITDNYYVSNTLSKLKSLMSKSSKTGTITRKVQWQIHVLRHLSIIKL